MKDSHTKKHISSIIMIILIMAFDRITKIAAVNELKGADAKAFIPNFIQFQYMENKGIAFSMFSNSRWVFVVLTAIVCIGILLYMYLNKCKSLWLYWSLGVLAAGGLGNLIDRALFGYVIDFIEPIFVNFAVFNIADCAVTCGAVSLVAYFIYDIYTDAKRAKEGKNRE